jgi:rhodanese-related sulfurtransferase
MLSIEEFCELCCKPDVQVVDLRRDNERSKDGFLEFAKHIPLDVLVGMDLQKDLDVSKKVIFHCKAGGRAARAAKMLRESGIENVDYVRGDFLKIKEQLK